MGYDSGFLTDEHHPALPYRESYLATDPAWKTTVDPTSWIHNSVVWYSQQFTVWLGPERLHDYIVRFKYGNQDISGNPGMNDGLTQAWLSSSLRISPLEQVSFLQKLVTRQLAASAHAYEMTARILAVGTLPNGWEVHGKAGTGYQMQANGPDLKRQVGWFVGWASRGGRTIVFAYAIADEQPDEVECGPARAHGLHGGTAAPAGRRKRRPLALRERRRVSARGIWPARLFGAAMNPQRSRANLPLDGLVGLAGR